jgi:hypothetical protein
VGEVGVSPLQPEVVSSVSTSEQKQAAYFITAYNSKAVASPSMTFVNYECHISTVASLAGAIRSSTNEFHS